MLVLGLVVTFLVIYFSIQLYNKKSAMGYEEKTTIVHKEVSSYSNLDAFYEQKIKGRSRSAQDIVTNIYLVEGEDSPIIYELACDKNKKMIVLYSTSTDKEAKERILKKHPNLDPQSLIVVNSPAMLRCIRLTFGTDNFKWIEN